MRGGRENMQQLQISEDTHHKLLEIKVKHKLKTLTEAITYLIERNLLLSAIEIIGA